MRIRTTCTNMRAPGRKPARIATLAFTALCGIALGCAAFSIAAAPPREQPRSGAQMNTPPRVGYGFDWLKPLTARCDKISDKVRKRFQGCRYGHAAGFGIEEIQGYTCPLSEASEYVVYATLQDCRKALDAMQSNAP